MNKNKIKLLFNVAKHAIIKYLEIYAHTTLFSYLLFIEHIGTGLIRRQSV